MILKRLLVKYWIIIKPWLSSTWFAMIAFFSVAYGVISFVFGDLSSMADKVCSVQAAKLVCQSVGIGNLPTLKEEKEWEAAVKAESCTRFESIYREQGWYSERARSILDTAKPKHVEFPLEIPFTLSVKNKGRSLTKSDALKRARPEIDSVCSGYSKAYSGQSGRPAFQVDHIECLNLNELGFCAVRGKLTCKFTRFSTERFCRAD